MRTPARDRLVTLGYVVLGFTVALWQRPGRATSDTKIDLHVDPLGLLERVASVWTPTTDLGAVHSSQYTGYLWPTGPFYALFDALGLSPWLVHRLWLGAMFALAAWGALKLMDALAGRPRGVGHAVAAGFYMLNPYTTVFSFRTSVILLGYVALPWLLLTAVHGVRAVSESPGWRDWRGWWGAAVFALVLTSSGGGINGAVVGWMLVGPLVLLAYEPLTRAVAWRDSGVFLVRAGLLSLLASLWWIVPLLIHAGYGVDFLQYTEGPRAIWNTNAVTEVLRLMAYWTSYASIGFYGAERPLFSEEGTMLFNVWVVGASLVLPALAVAGFVWTRRQRYAPFFLLLLLVGAAIETAGFPSGTPARQAMEWVYYELPLLRFMRTTQKAAPLVAVGVAGLLGLAAQLAWARLTQLSRPRLRRAALLGAPLALAALIAIQALPLVRGVAPDRQISWERIPAAWERAGADLDRELPANSRGIVLPGQVFAFYRWGGTVDHVLPRLTERPVAVRYETPYADAHAADLLTTVDGLVQQERLVPRQLKPLLRLMGVGALVSGSDDDISRSGAVDPAAAAEQLRGQGFMTPDRSYGPTRTFPPPAGDVGRVQRLAQVRRYDLPASPGLVRVLPAAPATIVDGSAQGLAGLAAFGALPRNRPVFYAADLSPAELRRQAAAGADFVVTDSNRRRSFTPTHTQQTGGRVLTADEKLDRNAASINPFPTRGSDAQTVSVLRGARYLRAPEGGGPLPFPERSAIHAFDGDPSTLWAAARYLRPDRRWLEVGFEKPRDVPYVDMLPVGDRRGIEREVDVNGIRAPLGRGVTRVHLGLRDVSALRIRLTKVDQPDSDLRGSGGFREIRIPGVRLQQTLRAPVLTAEALAGRDISRARLTYLFERQTGDRPRRRDRHTGSPLLELLSNRQDIEKQIDRTMFSPEARRYALDAWVLPSVDARDPALDRLAGLRGPERFDSSSRFQNQPRFRASSAFDGRPDTKWVSVWEPPSAPKPWISWSQPRPARLARVRLTAAGTAIRRPVLVRLAWPGGRTRPLPVGEDGVVRLDRPVRARSFRLTVLKARFAPDATERQREGRAVGVSGLDVPGLTPAHVPRSGELRAGCGSVRLDVAGRPARLRPVGTVGQLDAGAYLRARSCAGEAQLAAGLQRIRSLPGAFSVDLLRLRSAAPDKSSAPRGGGAVTDPGRLRPSSIDGARVELRGPSWLVLGQSWSRGWEARCDGRSLGEPRPIDGFENGWLVRGGCRNVEFAFAPQAAARLSYLAAGGVCLLLLVLVLFGVLRGAPVPGPALGRLADAPLARVPFWRAALVSLPVALVLSLLFAKRTGVVIFPLLTLILWRGVGTRLLTAVAAFLLGVVVPLLYALDSPRNRGGWNFEYAIELMNAHWVGVLAVVLLGAACWRALAQARAAPPGAATQPPGRSISPMKTARAEYSRKS